MSVESNVQRSLVTEIDQITPTWLTSILNGSYLAGSDSVVSCDGNQIAVGEGFAGRLFRLHLTFNEAPPATLIAKMATNHEPLKKILNEKMVYREAHFYERIASLVSIDIPKVYYTAYGDGELIIIMEDLGEIELGTDVMEATVQETEKALASIAQFHTQWWNHEMIDKEWVAPVNDSVDRDEITRALEASLVKHGDSFPYLAKCMRVFLKKFPKMPEEIPQAWPVTLIHGDFHRKNVHFRDDGSVIIFDWQVIERNTPITDIANWLLANLKIEDRQTHEYRLLRHYYDSLSEECASEYSFRKLKADYRQALVLIAVRLFAVLELVDLDIEGGEEFSLVVLERMEQAAKDHRLLIMFRSLGLIILLLRIQNLFR
jgi:thiamine kinase-like enzyme